ncbi:MAG: uracil-xanthine permease [Bacilli bacterium]|nr:uracil-xanthine permease [Bacilli bacterium]
MEMVYKIHDRPPVRKLILAAIQQVLAVMAGTIAVPLVVGNGLSQSAALLGAGVGTIIYMLITRFKSPVFLGSSFSFVGSMLAAFAGAATISIGYVGIIIGAILAGSVYLILSLIVKFAGTKWIDKVAPRVVIGPTVVTIGLTLAPNAISNLFKGNVLNGIGAPVANQYLCLLCGLVALFVSVGVSVYAHKTLKLIPFIIGILSGYALASIFSIIGICANIDALKIIDYSLFKHIEWIPDFAFVRAIKGIKEFESTSQFFKYFGLIAVSYVPLAFVCFTEHIADHKNLSFIINEDLLKEPGLSRTLLGDGCGSMIGAIFGGCPNTTYGESISCTALSRNASIWTVLVAALICIASAFIGPLMTFFATIPDCVMGGLCFALYGFIAASGFQMLKGVDMGDHRNIFVVATILVAGIGGLVVNFYYVQFSPIACALVIGIVMNAFVNIKRKPKEPKEEISKEE